MDVVPSTTAMSSETLSSVATGYTSFGAKRPDLSRSPRYGYPVVNIRDDLSFGLKSAALPPVEGQVGVGLVPYAQALAAMDARAAGIADGRAAELVWLLEHPPLYTAGTSANATDLIEARFPVYDVGRGGQFTYHGPGQRV